MILPGKSGLTDLLSLKEEAGGRALQSGGSLVYTLGYSAGQKNKTITEQKCPANLILRGTKWTVTKAELVPYCGFSQISRSGDSYLWYHGDIGLCSGGIAYMGIPADSLGDTFTYDVKADRYDATEYCHIDLNEGYYTFHGVVAGKRLYGKLTAAVMRTEQSSAAVW